MEKQIIAVKIPEQRHRTHRQQNLTLWPACWTPSTLFRKNSPTVCVHFSAQQRFFLSVRELNKRFRLQAEPDLNITYAGDLLGLYAERKLLTEYNSHSTGQVSTANTIGNQTFTVMTQESINVPSELNNSHDKWWYCFSIYEKRHYRHRRNLSCRMVYYHDIIIYMRLSSPLDCFQHRRKKELVKRLLGPQPDVCVITYLV